MPEKIIRLKKTSAEDFLRWLINELSRIEGVGLFNSFMATAEGRNYGVTLQRPVLFDGWLVIDATAKNDAGSLGDWGTVIKFQCLQLTSDACQVTAEYRNFPGIEKYFNAIWKKVQENFPVEQPKAARKKSPGRPPLKEKNLEEYIKRMAYVKTVLDWKQLYPAYSLRDTAEKYCPDFGYGYDDAELATLRTWIKEYKKIIDPALMNEIQNKALEILTKKNENKSLDD